jgi:hypothetical protein
MRTRTRYLTTLLTAAGVSAAIAVAPSRCGAAVHEHRSEHDAVCQTNGSSQIVTSPPVKQLVRRLAWGGGLSSASAAGASVVTPV